MSRSANSTRMRYAIHLFCAGILCLVVGVSFVTRSYLVHSRQRPALRTAAVLETRPVHMASLYITSVVQHGHVVEILGSTDPGAIVMINGEIAATIFDGNSFRYFVGPLPSGTTILTVTAQNQEGGVNTKRVAVTIE